MRKLAFIEGVQVSIDPCSDSGEIVQTSAMPAVSRFDSNIRALLIRERNHAALPENRIDIVFRTNVDVNINQKQLDVLISLLGLFQKRKGRKTSVVPTAEKPVQPSHHIPISQSAPVISQRQNQKGWVSWMWSAVGGPEERTSERRYGP